MTRTEITVVVGFYIFLMVMFWIGCIRLNIAKVQSVMSIKQRTAYAVLKAPSIMQQEEDHHSIILMATVVQCNVCMIGSISLANLHSIVSVE